MDRTIVRRRFFSLGGACLLGVLFLGGLVGCRPDGATALESAHQPADFLVSFPMSDVMAPRSAPARHAEAVGDTKLVKCVLCPKNCILMLLQAMVGTNVAIHGTCGCTLGCDFCSSSEYATGHPDRLPSRAMTPADFVAVARQHQCGLANFEFNEPTVAVEYIAELARACKANGIKTALFSNGCAAPAAYLELEPHLDVLSFGFKGFSNEFYEQYCRGSLDEICRSIETVAPRFKGRLGLSYVPVPGASDSDDMISAFSDWVATHLGLLVPIVVLDFIPSHRMATAQMLPEDRFLDIVKGFQRRGFRYVSTWNKRLATDSDREILCHACGHPLIRRLSGLDVENHTRNGHCGHCDADLPIRAYSQSA